MVGLGAKSVPAGLIVGAASGIETDPAERYNRTPRRAKGVWMATAWWFRVRRDAPYRHGALAGGARGWADIRPEVHR